MDKFKIIAGPCSAESEIQLLRTAEALKEAGVECLRAGLWKPRTYPGCFEGIGEKGLPWLQKVQRELGMKVCTEVAGKEHVRLCADAGVDIFWIGARTTVNSFLVQEIAESCKGLGIPVLIKNPVSRDIGLWTGAVERFKAQGVTDLGLVHRGFSTFEKIKYRNSPEWHVAIEMHSRFPGLPMYCDPSHIAGDRKFVPEIAQLALDLGFDGLMVEAHCNPESALSDAAQQLDSRDFGAFLSSLRYRRETTDNPEFNSELESLRATIDSCDEQILEALSKRMDTSRRIGAIKKTNNVAILQMDRWEKLVAGAVEKGKRLGLSAEFVKSLFADIHDASVKAQND